MTPRAVYLRAVLGFGRTPRKIKADTCRAVNFSGTARRAASNVFTFQIFAVNASTRGLLLLEVSLYHKV